MGGQYIDKVSWIYAEVKAGRNSTPFFMRNELGGRVYLIAANRAARRMLLSTTIKTKAQAYGATIEIDKPDATEPAVISIY